MKYIVNHIVKILIMNTIITSKRVKRVAMTLFIAAALINGVAVAHIRVTQSHTETPQSYTEFCPLFSSPKIIHSSKNAKNTKKNIKNISFSRFSQNFVYLCTLKF